MNRRRIHLTGIFLALSVAFLSTPLKAEVVKIRMGVNVSPHYYTLFLERQDLLKNYGKTYQIEWYTFSGGGDAMPALAANKLDGSLMTPYPFANAILKAKLDLTAVNQLISFGEEGHYADQWVVRIDSGINSPKDLKGKVIGINAIGSTLDMGVRIVLNRYGYVAGKDYTIVEAKPPHIPSMVQDKKLDCGVTFQPFYTQAHLRGGIKDIADDITIYGEPVDYVFNVFQTDFIKKNPQVIRDFLEDYVLAIKWARANRSEAARIFAKNWKLEEGLQQQIYMTKKDNYVRPNGKLIPAKVQRVMDVLFENGFLKEKFDVTPYIDNAYLPKGAE